MTVAGAPVPGYRRLGGAIALIVSAGFAIAMLVSAPADGKFGYDLDAYLAAAGHLASGQPIYPTPDATGGITLGPAGLYPYPPIWAAAFVPLAGLPIDTVRVGWFVAMVAVAAGIGAALVAPLPATSRPFAAAAYLTFLPLLSELRFGNLNLITLALCLLAWQRRDRPLVSGLVLSLAIGLKLLPAALVFFLLAGGRWRIVAWALGGWVVIIIATWPWMASLWIEYVSVVLAIVSGTPAINVVPAAFAEPPMRYILPIASVTVALLAGLVARRSAGLDRPAFVTTLAATPLLTTTVWYTYLILALPALLGSDGSRPGMAGAAPIQTRVAGWLCMQVPASIFSVVGLALAILGGLWVLLRGRLLARRSGMGTIE